MFAIKTREKFHQSSLPSHPTETDIPVFPKALFEELEWLKLLVEIRINEIRGTEVFTLSKSPIVAPSIANQNDSYSKFVQSQALSELDRLLLVIGLAPILNPALLNDRLVHPEQHFLNLFPEFGGYVDKIYLKYTPTISTLLFLLAGTDHKKYLQYQIPLRQGSKLIKEQVVILKPGSACENRSDFLNFSIQISEEYVRQFLLDEPARPDHGEDFPAQLISTGLNWSDLVLAPNVFKKINILKNWTEHGSKLRENAQGKIAPGFPCLFCGPPGTGKTLTAKLIGKSFNQPVFRVDLSLVVSKYIGETEKNLARLFHRAEGKNWILFFDEADALFGKRTDVKEANDRYGNQEIAYLLQRIEEYNGLILLSTNLKDNIDKALKRRFQLIIEFDKPGKEEVRRLWQTLLPNTFEYDPLIPFEKYDGIGLTGANISNIIKSACLHAISSDQKNLSARNIHNLIRAELTKENRTL